MFIYVILTIELTELCWAIVLLIKRIPMRPLQYTSPVRPSVVLVSSLSAHRPFVFIGILRRAIEVRF